MALFFVPVMPTISKLVSTCEPLIRTLNCRWVGWFIIGGLTDHQAADQRLSGSARSQLDYDIPVLVGVGFKVLLDGFIFASSGSKNVEAIQNRLTINSYAEPTLSRSIDLSFGKV